MPPTEQIWATPVFVGHTEEDAKIILYKDRRDGNTIHILRPDGELHAVSPGSELEWWTAEAHDKIHISIISPEWTGKATGTWADLIAEESLRR